ncbi:hypothetical protein PHPALM_27705 [Phytophthora palmivora]|uniref:Uncharacterized protein n=1 Tax=Phytophthora palmivora TaxID=4796 RepID=A0A2P4XC05_9STRA|nr:hypothetical protein PHPALM_27705 [Phytophthora palmivora]
MYAVIFKQQEPGIVDVYVHTYVETQGMILDKLVVNITWKATIGFWNAPHLAEMKKLQWCIANCRSERQKEQQRASSSALNVCKQCYERRSMMKRSSDAQEEKKSCVLCTTSTCYRCRVDRTLNVIDENSRRLTEQHVVVCEPCLLFVQKLLPTDIARLNHKQRLRQQRASS